MCPGFVLLELNFLVETFTLELVRVPCRPWTLPFAPVLSRLCAGAWHGDGPEQAVRSFTSLWSPFTKSMSLSEASKIIKDVATWNRELNLWHYYARHARRQWERTPKHQTGLLGPETSQWANEVLETYRRAQRALIRLRQIQRAKEKTEGKSEPEPHREPSSMPTSPKRPSRTSLLSPTRSPRPALRALLLDMELTLWRLCCCSGRKT